MDRTRLISMWDRAWTEGLWAASWSASLEGLTPAEASWQPANAPGIAGTRHAIWQIVLHMCLWREHWLKKLQGGGTPKEELDRLNFPPIADASETAWAAARQRFARTQHDISAALKNPATTDAHFEAIAHFLPHDCYHFGQINTIRAMLGKKPLE
ncbi:MAG: DinB family protein [Planctomycetes bacterium]|nr:DinB family protein [Planctomycetota bacterium]